MQASLPLQKRPSLLVQERGELLLLPDWLAARECSKLLADLQQELPWHSETLFIYGRKVRSPRLMSWHGDKNARYCYSGREHTPLPWNPLLLEMKEKLQNFLQTEFNSVLANLYRDGHDCMGWHADDEKELGRTPCIASVSLGASRYFDIRGKQDKKTKARITLHSGSLLVMRGEFQQHWQHQIPRQLRIREQRINLTFRRVRS